MCQLINVPIWQLINILVNKMHNCKVIIGSIFKLVYVFDKPRVLYLIGILAH
jgi:hypothetical protein